MKHERRVSLALSHARLKMAADVLRWSVTGETRDVLPDKEVFALCEKINEWSARVWRALYDAK